MTPEMKEEGLAIALPTGSTVLLLTFKIDGAVPIIKHIDWVDGTGTC